jgi:hypothetical protein
MTDGFDDRDDRDLAGLPDEGPDEGEEAFDPRPADPCEETAVLALLDGSGEAGPDGQARLRAHRAVCTRCAAEAAGLAAAADRVAGALLSVEPSRDLSVAVLARIRAERAAPVSPARASPARAAPAAPALRVLPRGPWYRSPLFAVAAAAAAVLLVAAGVKPALTGKWWWSVAEKPHAGPDPVSRDFVSFADATQAAGIGFRHHAPLDQLKWMAESVGSGVAAADFDGDGRPDLFFADSWSLDADRPAGAGCRLYLNRGDGTFEDATARAGIDVPDRVCGVVAADLDNDGNRDLVLACYGRVRVLHNRGGARFEDVSDAAGLPVEPESWYTCAAVADFDRDGVLDLFVTRYADQEGYRRSREALGSPSGREWVWRGLQVFAGPQPLRPLSDRLYRGLGGLKYRDESAALAGQEPRYGFQAVATDADGDGWIDVYVANDTNPNSLWRNLGGMKFRDEALEAGCAFDADGKAQAGMGVAVGDLEGDGLPEILVTNFSNDHLTIYGNNGSPGRPSFRDRSYSSGVGPASYHFLGWGALFADFDGDGEEDLLTANGHLFPNVAERPELQVAFPERMQLYQGLGHGTFTDRGGSVRGLSVPRVHRGLAALDFDGDGRMDVVATTAGGPPVLLRNTGDRGDRHWIGFRLVGTRSPRDPAGARVTVVAGGVTRTRELHLGDSFASSSEPVLRFGLGAAARVERVVVRWPSGAVEELPPMDVNRVHEVTEKR